MTRELTWLLDRATGALVAEGLEAEDALALAGDLLPTPRPLGCARPAASPPLPGSSGAPGPALRVARLYHGSLVDGPGRRSVVQLQGCPLRCPGFIYSLAVGWWPLRVERAAGHPAAPERVTSYG
jgi:anaerobic ribonucleoside-triphosphate reductase activating protein